MPGLPLKQADGGDAGSSGGQARVGILRRDAAQRQDRDRPSGCAREVEQVQAAALGDESFGGLPRSRVKPDFFKHRAEENQRWRGRACVGDFVQRVAGDADHRFGPSGRSVKPADIRRCERAFGGGEVDAIGPRSDSHVGAGVDQHLRRGRVRAQGIEQLARQRGESGGRQVLFAQLHVVDALCGESRGLVEQRSAVKDFWDDDEVRRVYYPEAERFIAEVTGASRVLAAAL